MSKRTPGDRWPVLLLVLFGLSGALGLVYEILWLRSLILVFGSTTFAVSTVLTAFMGGLAAGSFVFGRWADRLEHPVRAYAWMEVGIGAYALAVPHLFDGLVVVYRFLWREYEPSFYLFSLARFACALAVLAVPTFLMGGTLPLLSRFVTAEDEKVGRRVGTLYALNTVGAVAGTAGAGFALLPWLGMRGTLWLAAAGNLLVGMLALAAYGRARPARPPVSGSVPRLRDGRTAIILVTMALSGAVAMVYEVTWTRVVGLVIGGSVYAFTIMLTTFLVGLAGGAAVASRLADRAGAGGRRLLGWLLAAAGGTAFLTLLGFHHIPYAFAWLLTRNTGSPGLVFALKFAVAFAVMLLPTLMLGATFPVAVRACSRGAERLGRTVGSVYSANTLGTIVGSFLAGFVLLPALGVRTTLLLAIGIDLLLAAALLAGARRALVAAACGLAALALPVLAPPWDALVMNSGMYLYAPNVKNLSRDTFDDFLKGHGAELLYARDGATASIIVVREGEADNIFLATNGKVDASSRFDLQTQILSGHIPLLLVPEPRTVLVVGYASGMTVGSVLTHPVERLVTVEIEEAVMEASRFFDDYNNDPLSDPRTRVVLNDARNFLLVEDATYDVIISEPSNPWITVASNLFTREAFELGRSRLNPGGVYCQWIQLYGIRPEDLQAVLRTFHTVFPEVLVFTTIPGSDLLLVGSERPLVFDFEAIGRRMTDLSVAVDLGRVEVRRPEDLLAVFDFGTAELEGFLEGSSGPLNTDDNARIEFATPKSLLQHTGVINTEAIARARASVIGYLAGPPVDDDERAAFLLAMAEAYRRRGDDERARASAEVSLRLSPTPGARDLLSALNPATD